VVHLDVRLVGLQPTRGAAEPVWSSNRPGSPVVALRDAGARRGGCAMVAPSVPAAEAAHTRRRAHPRPGDGQSPRVGAPDVTIDCTTSRVHLDDSVPSFSPLSTVAQELIVAEGAENVVRSRLAAAAV